MNTHNNEYSSRYLTDHQVDNPLIICYAFNLTFDYPHTLKMVGSWVKSTYEGTVWAMEVPGHLWYFYERLLPLLEAAWVISKQDNSHGEANLTQESLEPGFNIMDPALYGCADNMTTAWELFPRALSRDEYINLYKVFTILFEHYSLDDWEEILHDMLGLALNGVAMEDEGVCLDLVTINTLLNKLMEAVYILELREPGKRTSPK